MSNTSSNWSYTSMQTAQKRITFLTGVNKTAHFIAYSTYYETNFSQRFGKCFSASCYNFCPVSVAAWGRLLSRRGIAFVKLRRLRRYANPATRKTLENYSTLIVRRMCNKSFVNKPHRSKRKHKWCTQVSWVMIWIQSPCFCNLDKRNSRTSKRFNYGSGVEGRGTHLSTLSQTVCDKEESTFLLIPTSITIWLTIKRRMLLFVMLVRSKWSRLWFSKQSGVSK